jgi:hypothetical protein
MTAHEKPGRSSSTGCVVAINRDSADGSHNSDQCHNDQLAELGASMPGTTSGSGSVAAQSPCTCVPHYPTERCLARRGYYGT